MARRLLAHVLITLAVLSLVATYFIWVVDATILNTSKLSGELQKSGVSSEIAAVLVERTTREMPEADKEQNKAKVILANPETATKLEYPPVPELYLPSASAARENPEAQKPAFQTNLKMV